MRSVARQARALGSLCSRTASGDVDEYYATGHRDDRDTVEYGVRQRQTCGEAAGADRLRAIRAVQDGVRERNRLPALSPLPDTLATSPRVLRWRAETRRRTIPMLPTSTRTQPLALSRFVAARSEGKRGTDYRRHVGSRPCRDRRNAATDGVYHRENAGPLRYRSLSASPDTLPPAGYLPRHS